VSSERATAGTGADPRYGWVWTVLQADCRSAAVFDEAELATLLEQAGVPEVSDAASSLRRGTEAILIGDGATATPADIDRLARCLSPGAVLAVAVGGNTAPAVRGSRIRRALRLPAVTVGAGLEARRLERRLRAAGLRTRRIATGERTGAHRIAVGGAAGVPSVGAVVVGGRDETRPTVLAGAVADAAAAIGGTPRIVDATVRGSGALLVQVSIPATAGRYLLRVVAGPATRLLDASLRNLDQIEAGAPEAVRMRVVTPIAVGDRGLARWSVEPKIAGREPRQLGSRLRGECLDFLIGLRSVPGSGGAAVDGLAADAMALMPHLNEVERRTLALLERSLVKRLGGLPSGWAHGDFWPGNLLARGGGLAAVIDWDAADPASLPLIDLLHLLALGDHRSRRLPHGRRCSEVLWPLARNGGNRDIGAYCEATGTPADPGTLEALALAYWLTRVARDLRTFADRAVRRPWMAENVHRPLSVLAARAHGPGE